MAVDPSQNSSPGFSLFQIVVKEVLFFRSRVDREEREPWIISAAPNLRFTTPFRNATHLLDNQLPWTNLSEKCFEFCQLQVIFKLREREFSGGGINKSDAKRWLPFVE